MSIQAMAWVFESSQIENPGERLVLLSLANHAKADGSGAWPAVMQMAKEARMSRRGVQTSLRSLEEKGAIRCVGQSNRGTNVYDVIMEEGADTARGGADEDTQGAQMATVGSAVSAPEPSLNHPYEPSSSSLSVVRETDPRPGFTEVVRILNDVATRRKARRAKPDSLLKSMLDFPGKDYVRAAHDLDFWMTHGRGSSRKSPNIAQTYRTFLQRAEDTTSKDQRQQRNEEARQSFMADDSWLQQIKAAAGG